MHEHDLELIAALAEGALDPREAEAAEADIASCDDCLTELAAQRLALTAVADAPRPGLSMAESADLRRAVRGAIGAEPEPEASPQRRPWLGLVTAAAVIALLLAVVPAANLLRTDSDSAAAETTLATDEAAAAATAPPATEAPAATSAPVTEAPTAAAEDMAGAPERDLLLPASRLVFESVDELDELLARIAEGIEDNGGARSLSDTEFRYYTNWVEVTPEDGQADCPVTAVTEEIPDATGVVTVGIGEFEGLPILLVAVTVEDETITALAIDASNCEIIGRVEG